MQTALQSFHTHTSMLRAIFWTFSGEASSKAAVLATTFAAARLLTTEEFSLYIGLLAASILASSASDAGLSQLTTREIAGGRISPRDSIFDATRLKLAMIPAWGTIYAVFVLVLSRQSDPSGWLVIAFGATSLVTYTQMPILATLRGDFRFRAVSLCNAVGRWVTASLVIAAVAMGPLESGGLTTIAISTLIGEITLLLLSISLMTSTTWKNNVARKGAITIRGALPFASNTVLALAYNRMDVILVAAIVTAREYSSYAPASRIQDALFIFPTAISAAVFPIFSKLIGSQNGVASSFRSVKLIVGGGLIFAIPFAIFVTIFTPQLIALFLGSGYESSISPTRILVWSMPFAIICSPLLAILAASHKPNYTTWVFASAFCTAFAMQFLLAVPFGANGAAVASLSRDPVSVITALVLVRRLGISKGVDL